MSAKGLRPVSLSSFYSFIWTNKEWLRAAMTCSVHIRTRVYMFIHQVSRKPVTNEKPVPMCLHSSLAPTIYFNTHSVQATRHDAYTILLYPNSRLNSIENVTLFSIIINIFTKVTNCNSVSLSLYVF